MRYYSNLIIENPIVRSMNKTITIDYLNKLNIDYELLDFFNEDEGDWVIQTEKVYIYSHYRREYITQVIKKEYPDMYREYMINKIID